MQDRDLIYDWNAGEGAAPARAVELNDETLRDGLQCPSATDPDVADKRALLHCMAGLGITAANIGIPAAGPRMRADALALAREIADARLPLGANCAARMLVADVEQIADVAQRGGLAIEAATFIPSSPIRRYVEGLSLNGLLRAAEEVVLFAVRAGLPVMFVTEDTTRADPATLRALYGNAIRWGARRICLADTVGHATPAGVRRLVHFVRAEIVAPSGEDVKVDWHGHRDRGLGLANALAAAEAGVDRVHATALGMGERVGNVEMDLLLINLRLLGVYGHDLALLPDYARLASRACGMPIAPSYPVLGGDAFRTGTGVHASAIAKARRKGNGWLADRVYSGVPAGDFGFEQRVEISPLSGVSNVRWWMEEHGYAAPDESLCRRVLDAAKRMNRVLTDQEIGALCGAYGAEPAGGEAR